MYMVPDINEVFVVVCLQAVNGKYDVDNIMDTWTRQMGFPVVTVKHIKGNSYRLVQERFLLNPEDKYNPESSKYQYV